MYSKNVPQTMTHKFVVIVVQRRVYGWNIALYSKHEISLRSIFHPGRP